MNNEPPLQPNKQDVPTWFMTAPDNSEHASIISSPPQAPVTPPRHWHPPRLLLGGILAIIIVIGAVILFVVLHPTNCLTPTDYESLTNTQVETNDPSYNSVASFYDTEFTFNADSTAYETAGAGVMTNTIRNLGSFYSSHSNKPMHVTLTLGYDSNSADGATLAKARVEKVVNDLVAMGVPHEVISTSTNGISMTNAMQDDIGRVKLSLTSADSCR